MYSYLLRTHIVDNTQQQSKGMSTLLVTAAV